MLHFRRVVKTAVVFCTAIIMITLPEMEVRTSSNTAEMSIIFVWLGVATSLGVLLIGPLFHYINGMLLLSICLTLAGVFAALAPTWQSLTAFQALAALMMFFHVPVHVGTISINRTMWKTSVKWMRPVIQMTVLMTAVGVVISTQIARHLLADHVQSNATVSRLIDYAGLEPVQVIYLIVGGLDVGMAVVTLLTCFWFAITSGQCSKGLNVWFRDAEDDDDIQLIPDSSDAAAHGGRRQTSNADDTLQPCSPQGRLLLTIVCLMLFMIHTHEVAMKALLYTYAYEYLGWSVDRALMLVMLMQLTHFILGAIMVPVSRWVSPTRLLVFDLTALIISNASMLLAFVLGDTFTLLGALFAGAGASNINPTVITLVDDTIHVTAPVLTLFTLALGVGHTTVSILGALLYYAGAASYPAMLLVLASSAMAFFIAYKVLCHVMKSTASRSQVNGGKTPPVTDDNRPH